MSLRKIIHARLVPEPGRHPEVAVPGPVERGEEVDDAGAELERGVALIQHSLAGTDARARARLSAPPETERRNAFLKWGRCPQAPGI
jgi:hypothetical protein